MRYVQIIFSPTGGTQRVADAISSAWGDPVEPVDLSDAGQDFSGIGFAESDVVLVAVPSYAGRVPETAANRFRQISGGGAGCVLVCVYGNRAYEDTLAELQDLAEACGFRVMAAVAAVAEHSILRQYAAGRPDEQDIGELRDFGKRIMEKVDSGEAALASVIPGNRPYKKAGGVGMVPKADKKCISCGLCAEVCPVQAISRENIRTGDAQKCISCMRCVAKCPEAARKVNAVMLAAAALALKKACAERKENELFL